MKTNTKKNRNNNILIYSTVVIVLLLSVLITTKFYYDKIKNSNKISNIYNLNVKDDDNFVFLGDSLTERYPLNEFYDGIPVVNSGIGGNTTDDILNDMEKRVYQYNPTKVFLLIGINDMKEGKDNNYIFNNIKKIVKNIKKNRPKCKIYVESLYPINDSDDEKIYSESLKNRSNKKIDDINKKLKKYYDNSDVTYIDINSKLKDGKLLRLSYTVDGVHLTALGYIKVSSILLTYMND